jgi:Ca-activated chloride channel family protein
LTRARLLAPARLALGVTLPALGAAQTAPQVPVFSADLSLVNVSVTVADGQGRPIRGLTARDFVLTEDGRRRTIVLCSSVGQPEGAPVPALDVALLVDTSESMLETLRRSQEAATRFLTDLPNTQERLVILFDQAQRLERFDPARPESLFARLARIPDGGNTALRDAVTFALRTLGASGGRAAIVLLTDGVDTVSTVSPEAMESAVQSKAVIIYAVAWPAPPGTDSARAKEAARTLENLARHSGGRMFRIGSGQALPGVLDEILADLRAQYVLGFAPDSPAAAGRLRRIRVMVPSRPRVVVRHRVGYRLGTR